jgi:hypothetical protein
MQRMSLMTACGLALTQRQMAMFMHPSPMSAEGVAHRAVQGVQGAVAEQAAALQRAPMGVVVAVAKSGQGVGRPSQAEQGLGSQMMLVATQDQGRGASHLSCTCDPCSCLLLCCSDCSDHQWPCGAF